MFKHLYYKLPQKLRLRWQNEASHQPRTLCRRSHYSHRRICLRRWFPAFPRRPGEHESNLLQSISEEGGSGNDKLEGEGGQNKLKSAVACVAGRRLEDAEAKWDKWPPGLECVCAHGTEEDARRYNIWLMTWSGGLGAASRPSAVRQLSVSRKSKSLFTGREWLRRRCHSTRSVLHASYWISTPATDCLSQLRRH